MKKEFKYTIALLYILLSFALSLDTAYALPLHSEFEDMAERLDNKYFSIFLQSIEMINKRQLESLQNYYEPSLLYGQKANAGKILLEEWKDHSDILFKDPKSLLKNGYKITFPIDWSADPLKNSTWVLYFQNLLWLNDYLAKGERGDEKAALTAFKIIKDWLSANPQWPPKNGKFVYDDHGMSERLRVFYKTLRLYNKLNYKDDEFYNLLLAGLVNHIALMSTMEKYNWNNHGIILDNSLLEVLNDLKEFKMRDEVQELAVRRILRQFRLAYTADGVHKEHSPCYHVWVTSFMLNSLNLIEKNSRTIPDDIKNIVDSSASFTTHVLKTDSTFPLFGDCSEGQSAFTSGAVAAKYYDDHPELRYVLSNGKKGDIPQDRIKIFPESGWTIFRDKWPPDIYAIVQSDFHSNVHYHEDDTSFVLSSYGNDLISDSGLYTYEEDPLSIYMVKARAHNVMIIDDIDFNSDLNNIGLSGITRSFQNKAHDGLAMVELTHPHYDHMGIKTYRKFGMIGKSDFVIDDRLESKSRHKSTQLFHFAPGAHIEFIGNKTFKISWERHSNIVWLKSDHELFDIVEGATDPVQGWYFPKFGVSVPQPVLRLHKKKGARGFFTLISISQQKDSNPDWAELKRKSNKLIKTLEKLPRRVLNRESLPPKWIPTRKKAA